MKRERENKRRMRTIKQNGYSRDKRKKRGGNVGAGGGNGTSAVGKSILRDGSYWGHCRRSKVKNSVMEVKEKDR